MALFRRRHAPADADVSATERELTLARRTLALIEPVVENMSEGVVVLNEVLTPVLLNTAARRILDLGIALPSVVPLPELMSLARATAQGTVDHDPVEVSVADRGRTLRLRATKVEPGGLMIVYVADVTEEARVQAMRRQFVAHASHELKTPVAGIQALAEALMEAVTDDPEAVAKFSARTMQEAARLGELVSDLLDLSRLEDPASISRSLIDLAGLVTVEAEDGDTLARAKGVALIARIEPDVMVRGDAGQLALMIRNLLDNAIRYSASGDEVSISLVHDDQVAELTVTDTGQGIPLRDQARVFERFYRVDEGRARSEGGTGLGLAIVKHVVDLHSGRVLLTSQLGEGSTFTVRIPGAGD
jgi:two-component system, OmpR family, sensor histidine kinase SenX3